MNASMLFLSKELSLGALAIEKTFPICETASFIYFSGVALLAEATSTCIED